MIAFLDGTVKAIRKNFLVLMTDYVGYKIFVPAPMLVALSPAQKVSFFVHTYVREDQISLYGFPTLPELEFFELLLSVSGIGPKTALGVMSLADISVIKSGIASGDASVFTKVSGVGRKTAERLILELKEKIEEGIVKDNGAAGIAGQADVIEVLMALGYSRTEARGALSEIPVDLNNAEDKIKHALRSLAKK